MAKLATNDKLRQYVQDRLAGVMAVSDGTRVPGPNVHWNGRRHGPRQDRRWATSWSPEQIANRLLVDFPQDESMRVSHEAIYQALYVQGRGALRRELVACLRTGRALRVPRARTRRRGKNFVSSEVMISERPAEAEDRAVPGHWEGDLIVGLGSSAIGTLVERTTRFTMLLHLPRMDDYGQPRIKNGPALAGHGAEAVRDAIASAIVTLPQEIRRSLTWDQGAEMAQHVQLRIDTGLPIYFCDPHSPWQRGTNENTNGLLRQYFPKGTDLSRHSRADLDAVAVALNTRPRKTLGWRTPVEALGNHLCSVKQHGVATTLEPKQYLSMRYTDRLVDAGIAPSVGSQGDAYDNALAESVIGLYKTEVIRRKGPWRTLEAVEFATLTWVDWFNTRRLLGPLGDIPPAEFEAQYYEQAEVPDSTNSVSDVPGTIQRAARD